MGNIREREQKLLVALANNEPKAFESLYKLYGKRLFEFINTYLNSKADTEEIIQEVFIKIWQKRSELDSQQSFKGYLFTIAYNAIKKSFNKKKIEEKIKSEFIKDQYNDSIIPAEEISLSDVMQRINLIVDQMPEKRKQIFNLCKNEGLSIKETANYLNISEKTVKNQLTSAYQIIREQLKNNLTVLLALNLFF